VKQRTTSAEGATPIGLRRLKSHRRPIAAALAALSVAFGLAAVRPLDPAGVQVLTAAHDLPGGTALRKQDVRPVALPPAAVPGGALRNPVTGRVLAGPMRRGEVITDARLVGGGLLKRYGPGIVAAPVRVADAATIRLLRPGDHVDVLAADAPTDPGTADFDLNAPGTPAPHADDALPQAPTTPIPDRSGAPPRIPAAPTPDRPDTPPRTPTAYRQPDTRPSSTNRPCAHDGAPPVEECPANGGAGDGSDRIVRLVGPVGDRTLPSPTAGFPDARVVAAAVPVIAVLRDDAETGDQGGLIVLATSREQAAALAGAAGTRLSVTIVGE
jgi:SAF domain